MGVGGLGIGDWGLGPIPNPQSPIPNPQSPIPKNILNIKIRNKSYLYIIYTNYKIILIIIKKAIIIIIFLLLKFSEQYTVDSSNNLNSTS